MENTSKTRRGRPPVFDRMMAVDAAVKVFWAKGYDGASIDDLTEAMRISRPSLYSVYRNKHSLFLACLDRYSMTNAQRQAAPLFEHQNLTTGISCFMNAVIEGITGDETPKGCLIACVAMELADRDQAVREKLASLRAQGIDRISEHVAGAKDFGHISSDLNPHSLARMILFVAQGLAIQARRGATKSELKETAHSIIGLVFDKQS